ncbi:MAG: flavodoxin family protein [Clostridia bacterium]|nr:flavodoxin family protein [Clostridia bacterium]
MTDNHATTGAPKVILLNGSPHKEGTTNRALTEVKRTLESEGIEAEIIHVGHLSVRGCSGCYACGKLKKCVHDDIVNEIAEKLRDADGLVIGSPVYYASPNGGFLALLDRLFYSSRFDKSMKVGASVVAARRGGCTASFDVLNKYFTISDMPIVSARYWNQVHGNSAEDAESDLEGLHTMRGLGKNMAFLIKCIRLGKEQLPPIERESKVYTNFIRKDK